MVKVIGHRGAQSAAPENTLAAFRAALDLGVHGIEFDVQQSVDGELVVIHDLTLDRTTDGSGLVAATSFDEISRLDAGSWFAPDFAGERIPRLVQVLDLSNTDPELEFELELKGYGRSFLDAVLAEVTEGDVLDRVEFTSSNVPLLSILKTELPAARVGFFTQPQHRTLTDHAFEHHIIGLASTVPFDVVHVRAADITTSIVERLHALGFVVHANDALNADEVLRALESGADRCSVDDVELALAVTS